MLPYWILLGVFALGALLFEGRKTGLKQVGTLLAIACFGTFLMIGLRYKVGADWEPYRLVFWDVRFTDFSGALARSDPFFGLLNWLVRKAGLEFWVVNTVCAAIFMYGLFSFAQRQKSPWLVLAVAAPYLVIVVGMGYNRQATAIAFALLALNAIQNRALSKFLVFMILASTFHRSALLLLPVIALSYSRNRFITVVLTATASAVGYFLIVAPEVDTYIDRYSGAEQGAIESSGTLVRIFMNVVPAILFFLTRKRMPADDEYLTVWRNFALLSLASLAAFAYFGNNTAVDRLSLYLIPLQLFVLGNLSYALGGKANTSKLIAILVVAYSVAVQVVWLIFATNASYWVPYRTYPL